MKTRFRSKMFELGIKRAAVKATVYFQSDPKSGRYRGIVEEIGEGGEISFKPEKPLIGSKQQILNELSKIGYANLPEKGESSPWHAESNMPFDLQGNRV